MSKISFQFFFIFCTIYLLAGCASSSTIAHSRYIIDGKYDLDSMALNGKSEIVGRVIDVNTGELITGANVVILSSRFGSASDIDGAYKISALSSGEYDIKVTYIGYEPSIASHIELEKNCRIMLDFKLAPRAVLGGCPIITAPKKN